MTSELPYAPHPVTLQRPAGPRYGDPAAYASRADMVRDMADPRYHAEPDFRRAVAMRLAATDTKR